LGQQNFLQKDEMKDLAGRVNELLNCESLEKIKNSNEYICSLKAHVPTFFPEYLNKHVKK
jgi:hypothetical protein